MNGRNRGLWPRCVVRDLDLEEGVDGGILSLEDEDSV